MHANPSGKGWLTQMKLGRASGLWLGRRQCICKAQAVKERLPVKLKLSAFDEAKWDSKIVAMWEQQMHKVMHEVSNAILDRRM